MLYDVDSFGFIYGYVSKNWNVMSEQDLLVDEKLAKRLYEAKYQTWKRRNFMELHERYEVTDHKLEINFDEYCRRTFRKINS